MTGDLAAEFLIHGHFSSCRNVARSVLLPRPKAGWCLAPKFPP